MTAAAVDVVAHTSGTILEARRTPPGFIDEMRAELRDRWPNLPDRPVSIAEVEVPSWAGKL